MQVVVPYDGGNLPRVPKRILLPLVVLFSLVGMFGVSNSMPDIWMMMASGVMRCVLSSRVYEGEPPAATTG